TTPAVQRCRSSVRLIMIQVPALLRLAEWIRSRREQSLHGGPPCDTLVPAQSPPAHAEAESASTAANTLGSASQIGSRSGIPEPEPRRRSANPKASCRQGGQS